MNNGGIEEYGQLRHLKAESRKERQKAEGRKPERGVFELGRVVCGC